MTTSTQRSLRARWWQLRRRLRRIPWRIRLGLLAAMVAVAGLLWQHTTHHVDAAASDQHLQRPAASSPPGAAAAATADLGDHPDVDQLPAPTVAPQLASIDAGRAVATRFATNFASPNGNHDDWLARITPDASQQLIEQYRLTDIRNLPQATVSSVDGPLDELPGAVAFRATYSDGTQIEIRLALATDGWKVANVVPVNTTEPASPAPPTPGGQ